MSKIFLFNPPDPQKKGFTREGRCTQEAGVWATQWPPVSLATTATFLDQDNHSVTVIDFPAAGLKLTDLIKVVKKTRPHFAIWNTATPTLPSDLSIGRIIKDISPESVTGVMGTHVSALPEDALSDPSIDVVIRREPELTIRNLCSSENLAWNAIDGISFRNAQDSEIQHNPDARFLHPNEIPFPSWQHLDLSRYRLPLKGKPFLIVAPVRGCPYPCDFCTAPIYYGRRLRKRAVESMVDEMQEDLEKYGVDEFFIWADTFTADKAYVRQLCQEITARRLKISWTCNSRVDTVDRDTLVLMKEAGLWMISFGIESGNDEILKQCGKNISVEQSIRIVAEAHRLGIKTSGHFMFGFPGETKITMEQTLALALKLPLDIAQFYTIAPFPGTELYRQATENGWIEAGSCFSQASTVMDMPGLPSREVEAFRKYAYRKFYMRTKNLTTLLSMVEPSMVRNIATGLKHFFRWAL